MDLESLKVFQIAAVYGVSVAEINSAIDEGILPARDVRRSPDARHAYRVIRAHAEAWIASGCPVA